MTERDQFIHSQVQPMLRPGERILHFAFMLRQPGLVWQILLVGGLLLFLMTKAYYVVLTDRRMILVRTKQGFFKPQMVNVGVEEWDAAQLVKCTTSGLANNRSMTFHFRDGNKQTLRISPWFKMVSGTKAFFDQVPPLVSSGQLAASAAVPAYQPAPMLQQAWPQPYALAPGSNVLVLWGDGNRYPGTVMQSLGDQVLCAMPDGQQQWVPAQSVAPTS